VVPLSRFDAFTIYPFSFMGQRFGRGWPGRDAMHCVSTPSLPPSQIFILKVTLMNHYHTVVSRFKLEREAEKAK